MATATLIIRVLYLMCALCPLLQARNLQRRPFGSRMCKALCRNTCCSSYVFEKTHLVCWIEGAKNDETRQTSEMCPVLRKIIHTKSRDQKHETLVPNKEACVATGKQEAKPFFLISLRRSPRNHRLLHVLTHARKKNTFKEYPYITVKYVTAMAYISTPRKLLLSMGQPAKVVSTTLYTHNVNVVAKYGVKQFAVDQQRQLVFVIYKIHFVGCLDPKQSKTTLVYKKHNTRSITLDTDKETVYALHRAMIVTFNYEGKNIKLASLTKNDVVSALGIDPIEKALYFNERFKLQKRSLTGDSDRSVAKLTFTPTDIQFFNKLIILSDYQKVCILRKTFCMALDIVLKKSTLKLFTVVS